MAIKGSGSISISEINAEFNLGNNLNSYRGVQWYVDNASSEGFFSSAQISMSEFYGKRKTMPITPSTITYYTPGTYTFYKPKYFNLLGVVLWGGGGSSGSHYSGGTVAGGGDGGWINHVYTTSRTSVNTTETVVVGAGGTSSGTYNGAAGGYSSFGNFAFARGGNSGGGVSYGVKQYAIEVTNNLRSGWALQGIEAGGWGGWARYATAADAAAAKYTSNWGLYNGVNTSFSGGGGSAAMNDPYQSGRPYTSDFYGGKAAGLAPGSSLYISPPSSTSNIGLPTYFQSKGAGGYGQVNSTLNGGGGTTIPEFRYGKFPGGGGGGADGVTGGGVTSPGAQGAVHIYWY